MAKFQSVVNLWDVDTDAAIKAGRIKLQRGQYVRCGDGGPLSRFVAYRDGVYNVVHGGTGAEVRARFQARCAALAAARARFGKE